MKIKKQKKRSSPLDIFYIITLILFVLYIGGQSFLKEFFSIWYIRNVIIAGIILFPPIGFTISLLAYARATENKWKKLYQSIEFLFIYTAFAFMMNFNVIITNTFSDIMSSVSLEPSESIIEMLEDSSYKRRHLAARSLFRDNGVRLYYKDSTNTVVQYEPTSEDSVINTNYTEIADEFDYLQKFSLQSLILTHFTEFIQFIAFFFISFLVLVIDFFKQRNSRNIQK